MQRIATTTVAADLFGAGKDGFTSGNPNSQIAPTQLSAGWCNGVQEELVRCIEFSGQTLDADDNTQLAKAIPYLAGHQVDAAADDLIFSWQSEHTPTIPGCRYERKTDTATTSSDLAVVMCFFTPPDNSAGLLRYTVAAVRVGVTGDNQAKTVCVRFKKQGGVTESESDFQIVESPIPTGDLGFDFTLAALGGSVALSFKPNLGEDPDQNYNVFVVGEMFCVKS